MIYAQVSVNWLGVVLRAGILGLAWAVLLFDSGCGGRGTGGQAAGSVHSTAQVLGTNVRATAALREMLPRAFGPQGYSVGDTSWYASVRDVQVVGDEAVVTVDENASPEVLRQMCGPMFPYAQAVGAPNIRLMHEDGTTVYTCHGVWGICTNSPCTTTPSAR